MLQKINAWELSMKKYVFITVFTVLASSCSNGDVTKEMLSLVAQAVTESVTGIKKLEEDLKTVRFVGEAQKNLDGYVKETGALRKRLREISSQYSKKAKKADQIKSGLRTEMHRYLEATRKYAQAIGRLPANILADAKFKVQTQLLFRAKKAWNPGKMNMGTNK
jgi:hypothetical protein